MADIRSSSPAGDGCPDEFALREFTLGNLSHDSLEAIGAHLAECSRCEQALASMAAADDPVTSSLRVPRGPELASPAAEREIVQCVAELVDEVLAQSSEPSEFRRALAAKTSGDAIAAEAFIAAITANGLLSADELAAIALELPLSTRQSAFEIAEALVARDKLTAYQAAVLYERRPTPLVLGEYTILKPIGAGGMGQVFKACHRRMDRMVAIKLLASSIVDSPEAVRRFEREVRAAAKLSHPNIVTAHDAGQQQNSHFLVMEFVDGLDLSSLVKQRGPLSVPQAVDCIRQAACGLAFAHAKGIVHRDVKPGNLLIDRDGTVKVLDMGLARIDSAGDNLTGTEQVMGTVDYMSPEQAMNTHAADARADIYALGCTLWYLLTGTRLYDGDSAIQRVMQHATAPIPSLAGKRNDVPAQLDQLFGRLIAKRPDERMQTMAEVIAALDALHVPQERLAIDDASSDSATDPAMTRTATLLAADIQTDPKTESVLSKPPTTAAHGGRGKPPSRKVIAAGAAGLFTLLLGVIVVIRNKHGDEVARVEVPDGRSVEVFPLPAAAEGPGIRVQSTASDSSPQPSPQERENNAMTTADPVSSATRDDFNADVLWLGDGNVSRWEPDGKSAWDKMTGTRKMVRAARSGATITTLRANLREYSIWRPRVVVVQIGTNETGTASETARDFEQLVADVGTIFPRSAIVLTSVIPRGSMTLENLKPVNGDIRRLADDRRIFFVNLDPVFFDATGFKRPEVNDGGKVLPLGYERWGEAMEPLLTQLLVATQSTPLASPRGAPPLAIAPFEAAQARAHQEAWAAHFGTTVETTNSVGAKMILIPPGQFLMGSTDEQVAAAQTLPDQTMLSQAALDKILNAERPQHRVVITRPWLMGATEVTIGQFRQFVAARKYVTEAEQYGFANSGEKALSDKIKESDRGLSWRAPGYAITDDMPVTQISWNDAVAFCNWLSDQEKLHRFYYIDPTDGVKVSPSGTGYRLPTEAEWEYACRAGTTTQYSFGDDSAQLEQYGWIKLKGSHSPHPVGTKMPNAFGLHDVHGNVDEWCQEFFDATWYEKNESTDPTGPIRAVTGNARVTRGGAWNENAWKCRSAYRYQNPPS
ncbi:MAG TPA: SUMF1/EgtB/PvdO family nonheme iron enzyme, partial [Pirellulales bacterium]|nr:SUMF1/EgtB/PvdO family nonheme iron enzyme [Pirellulales bacterium]